MGAAAMFDSEAGGDWLRSETSQKLNNERALPGTIILHCAEHSRNSAPLRSEHSNESSVALKLSDGLVEKIDYDAPCFDLSRLCFLYMWMFLYDMISFLGY